MAAFLEALAERPLLFDGAIGSLLYDHGVLHTTCYDELNLSRPELLSEIHREYRAAGADILETNTFGANRIALARHGHGDGCAEINRAAVALAREAADGAFVAGAVGPDPHPVRGRDRGRAGAWRGDALAEQIDGAGRGRRRSARARDVLLDRRDRGGDRERPAARHPSCRSSLRWCSTPTGSSRAAAPPRTSPSGCRPPAPTSSAPTAATARPSSTRSASGWSSGDRPVSIQPNAGLPEQHRRPHDLRRQPRALRGLRPPDAQVAASGSSAGCCGTTPEHVRAMHGAVRMMGGGASTSPAGSIARRPRPQSERRSPAHRARWPSAAGSALGSPQGRVRGVGRARRTDRAPTLTKALEHVRERLAGGIDIVNVADGPRASARMSNLAFCARAAAATGVEPILHVCCRDRNYLGLIAHLLGAHALGHPQPRGHHRRPAEDGRLPVRHAGVRRRLDRPARDRRPASTPGSTRPGKELDGATSFVLATGAEPGAVDRDRELERLGPQEGRRCRARDDPAGLRPRDAWRRSSTTLRRSACP